MKFNNVSGVLIFNISSATLKNTRNSTHGALEIVLRFEVQHCISIRGWGGAGTRLFTALWSMSQAFSITSRSGEWAGQCTTGMLLTSPKVVTILARCDLTLPSTKMKLSIR